MLDIRLSNPIQRFFTE